MTVVSVSMPESLLERIDGFADEHGYTGRSEVVREAARNLLGEFDDRKLEGRRLLGVVTVLFDYETSAVENRMMQLRHEHDGLVTSNVHNHVGDRYCMELFVLEGSLAEISTFVGKIRATRDTLSVDYSVIPVDEFGATPVEPVDDDETRDATDAPDAPDASNEPDAPDAPDATDGGDGAS